MLWPMLLFLFYEVLAPISIGVDLVQTDPLKLWVSMSYFRLYFSFFSFFSFHIHPSTLEHFTFIKGDIEEQATIAKILSQLGELTPLVTPIPLITTPSNIQHKNPST